MANGGAFTQEFWIGTDHNVEVRSEFPKLPLDLATGADRNSGFGGYNGQIIEMRRHLGHCFEHMGEVSIAVTATHWRAHCEKCDVCSLQSGRQGPVEMQAAPGDIALNEFV